MITVVIISCLILGIVFAGIVLRELHEKSMHIWLGSYLSQKKVATNPDEPVHIMFAFCDHFEPRWGKASETEEDQRVDRWCEDYPKMAAKHRDADGCYPKHSFFYPEEEYRKRHLDKLVKLCKAGFGEIEIHIHHDNDTAEGLTTSLQGFLKTLDEAHGAIPRDPVTGEFRFSFIHGNWALDNSREDGRWCGVNNELAVLKDLGCYADLTLPSAPSETQTRKINSIYYATGKDGESKSHNDGVDVAVAKLGEGDLLIIQGPLTLNWRNRKYGILPRIENSDIRESSPPSSGRVDLWRNSAIHVQGKPNWVFIKIHTHGTQEGDMDTLLGPPVDDMFSYLESHYNDGKKYILHYVCAREMYNIIKAAEAGEEGTPNEYRDYLVPKPPMLNEEGTKA